MKDPRIVAALAAGENAGVKLDMLSVLTRRLLRHIEDEGFSFEERDNAPAEFINEKEHAAVAVSHFIACVMAITEAEELVEDGSIDINKSGDPKVKFGGRDREEMLRRN